jgi:hypothetical protein
MSTFDLEVKLDVDFGRVSAGCRDALADAIVQTVECDIKPLAVELSPWLTGTNRRSIETDWQDSGNGIAMQLFTTSGYGGYLEAGTRKMAARPYLYPAFLYHRKGFFKRLRDIIRRALGKRR